MSRKESLVRWILQLPRPTKRAIALGCDAAICLLTVYLAFYLRLGYFVPLHETRYPMFASVAIALPLFVSLGLYRAIFRYSGNHAMGAIVRAVALYAVPFAFFFTVMGMAPVPRTLGIIQPLLLFLFIAASRMAIRSVLGERRYSLWRRRAGNAVIVYGAGSAGRQLAEALRDSREMRLVAYVDDDVSLWRSTINGVPVLNPGDIQRIVTEREVTDVLLAIPSATRQRRNEILLGLKRLNVHVRSLPGLIDLARGTPTLGDLRELEIEDLLGRAAVAPNLSLQARNIEGQVVMVTGAGGSIGSELCKQIIALRPSMLLLLDVTEYNLYAVHMNLTRVTEAGGGPPIPVIPMLGSVCDSDRVTEILLKWRPHTIFHAAAYKHVPLVEHNVIDGVRNNAFGTLNVAELARAHGVRNFVLVSTDKAVRPTNVMGASKRLAEMLLQTLQQEARGNTVFAMVRFGNVLGSSGSVVPLFRSQIAAGGPLTVTHADITRYFMTIPEAAQLVLQAGAMARGGEVFLLDMGEPVRVMDLARNMIQLSGLTVRDAEAPDGDIAIEVTGLRPGEKLYEELLIDDHAEGTANPRIMRSNERFTADGDFRALVAELRAAMDARDAAGVREILQRLVVGFTPNSPLADFVADVAMAPRLETSGSTA